MASLYERKDSKYIQIRFYHPIKRKGDSKPTPFLKADPYEWKMAEEYLKNVFEKWLRDLKDQMKYGITVPKELDLKEAYQLFREVKVHIKPGTLRLYDTAVYNHMLPSCGNKPVKAYTDLDYARLIRHFQSLKTGKKDKGLKKHSQAIYLRHLSSVWKYFVKKKWAPENIIETIKPPKKIVEVIPAKDIQTILDFIRPRNTKHYHTICLLLYTGWRVSTLLEQRWEDIDIEACQIKVTNVKSDNDFLFPLHGQLKGLLLEMGVKKSGPLVDYACYDSVKSFWDLEMKYMTQKKKWNNSLRKWEEVTPLLRKKYTLHQWRKTFNSLLANRHIDSKDLKLLLDHSDIKITLEAYTHLEIERIKDEIDQVIRFPK